MTARYPIETDRLLLRPKTLDDVDAMLLLYGDPEVAAWIQGDPFDREQMCARIERHVKHERDHGSSMWAVVERATGDVIGHCGLQHLDGGPEVEIGWAMIRPAWGRGYATEAARASLVHGFDVLGLEEIVAVARAENVRSLRVVEKLGMEPAGRGVWYGTELVRYVTRRAPPA